MSAVLGKYTQLIADKQVKDGFSSKEIEVIRTDGQKAFTKCGQTINIYDLFDPNIYVRSNLDQVNLGMGNSFCKGAGEGAVASAPNIKSLEPTLPQAVRENPPQIPVPERTYQAPILAVDPKSHYTDGQKLVDSAITFSRKNSPKKTIYVELPLTLDFDVEVIKKMGESMGVSDIDMATVVSNAIQSQADEVLKQLAVAALGVEIDLLKQPESQPEVVSTKSPDNKIRVTFLGTTFLDPIRIKIEDANQGYEDDKFAGYILQDLLFDVDITREILLYVSDVILADVNIKDFEIQYEEPQFGLMHEAILNEAYEAPEERDVEDNVSNEIEAPEALNEATEDDLDIDIDADEIEEADNSAIEEAKEKTAALPRFVPKKSNSLADIWKMRNN